VKIRAEVELNVETAWRWVDDVLQKERDLLIHHPRKTWFIVRDSASESIMVGSICPRLNPLHHLLKSAPESLQEQARYLSILQSVFRQYFQLAKLSGIKLDEGLSNFAIDDSDTVYYLDDEYYAWDNFIAFSSMFGVFLRSVAWLDKGFVYQLTESVGCMVDGIFQDSHCKVIISSQLKPLFMPSGQKEALLNEAVRGFSKIPLSAENNNRRKFDNQASDRYLAIMGDVHANEPALDVVLAFYKEKNIHQGIVLGDSVGYGPDPLVCIEKLQASGFEIIKGNHDHAVATGKTERGYSADAKSVIYWTIDRLDAEYREWLEYLPSFLRHNEWFAVHGAPMDPAFFYGYVYMMTAEDNLDYMQEKKISLCFHGHSHMQGVYARDTSGKDSHFTGQLIKQEQYQHMLVCPGSVGQPRNGDPNAQCAIYDQVDKVIEFFSLPYAVESVIQRMEEYDFSDNLQKRLRIGK
jgi:diadenosine tetraphosphatase ApaH/serine/threonine PP2A family protein phosphatase